MLTLLTAANLCFSAGAAIVVDIENFPNTAPEME